MGKIQISQDGFKCERCGHEWIARKGEYKEKPALCPKCKSAYWDKKKD